MRALCYATLIAAVVILAIGIISKFLISMVNVRPLSYLELAQLFLLFGINFALLELLKK